MNNECDSFVHSLAGGEIIFQPHFITPQEADALLAMLVQSLTFEQRTVQVFGKHHLTPRLVAWCADEQVHYTYSNDTTPRQNWHPALFSLKQRIERTCDTRFNGALLNYYRDGDDSMGWHSDDEASLGEHPVIASISLGASRDFKFRPKPHANLPHEGHAEPFAITLTNGSLLLMKGATQTYWQHTLPKRKRVADPRLNITFRTIIT